MRKKSYAVRQSPRSALSGKKEKVLLKTIDIELTERCNNNCIHCCINLPENDQVALKNELTTKQWQYLIKQAVDLGALKIRFTGGEPLLRKDFTELYLYARRMGLKVLLFTNARLITAELAALFSQIPPLEPIEVTVYGLKKASYESVSRKPGSFSEFKRGVDLLLSKKIPFIVKSPLVPPIYQELEDLLKWASTIPGMDSMPSLSMFFDLRHRRDSLTKNNKISTLRISPEQGMKIFTRQADQYRKDKIQFCSNFLNGPSNKIFNCNYDNMLCIDSYGKIQYCLPLRHPEMVYDCQKYSLKKVVSEIIPSIREQVTRNPEYLNRCGKCFLRGLCEQCPSKAWIEHGVLDKPVEYLCKVAHVQARYLGLLDGSEKAWQITNWRDRITKMKKKQEIYNGD